MVSIFTGLGSGFSRGSANVLGGSGQIGGGLLGRAGEGVSVNAATGNLLVSRQDEFLVGLGPDIAIGRTYNSQSDAADGDNGDQWQQSTHRRVFGLTGTLGTAGSTISRLSGDGSVVVYSWVAGRSAYVTREGSGALDTLTHAGGVWTWIDGDTRSTESYDAHGADNWRITAAADKDGNTLSFTYSGDKLDKVTTADGAWTQYGWTGNAITSVVTGYTDLATSTAKTLTRVRYAYDGQGRLSTVTTDLTPGDNSVATGPSYVTTYTYHGTSNRIATIAQSDGSLLAIAYDGSDRVQTLTQTVASGVTRVTTLTYGTNYTTVTGPDGQVTRLDYDAAKQLTKITAPPPASGATAQEIQFGYDTYGNVTSVTDGQGEVTTYAYDANGNVTFVTDPLGNTVTRSYDSQNRLITELTTGADRDGPSIAHYQQYVYDSEGHLRFAVNAAGQTTEYRYSAAGQLTRTIQYVEHRMTPPGAAAISEATAMAWVAGLADKSSVRITQTSYDARGNAVTTTAYGIASTAGEPLTSEGTSAAHFTYDQAGNLIERHAAGGVSETFVYDGMGRLTSSVDVHGGTTTIVFNDAATTTTVTTALGYTSVSTYNKAGELISKADSGANTVGGTDSYQYDAAGRLRMVTDATGRKSYFYYDKAGRKVAEANHLGEITEYRYDAAGRMVASITYASALGSTALTAMGNPASTVDFSTLRPTANAADVWSWSIYDDAGNLIQAIDNLGGTVVYEYDTENKLAKTTAFFNTLSASQLTSFRATLPTSAVLPTAHAKDSVSRVFYNKAGQMIGSLDGEGYLTELTRDGAGLEIQRITYAAQTNAADRGTASLGTLKAQVSGSLSSSQIAYSVYDGQGLLRYTVNVNGGITGLEYDAAGRLTKTTAYANPQALTDFTYDAVKAAVTTNAADRISWTVYDTAGRAAYTVDAEGGVTALSYDTQGGVTKVVAFDNAYGSTVTLAALNSWASNTAQTSDAKNRITHSRYSERGELLYAIDAEGYATRYTYDAEGRVLSKISYGGNPLSVSDATTIAQITTALSNVAAANIITVSTTYDNAGRVLTSTDGEGFVTRNVYNALGQLTDVIVADGTSAAVTTRYTYDNAGRVLSQTNAFGTADAVTVQYGYDGLGNKTSVIDARGNTSTFTYDRLGQVLTATNALGGVTSYTYDAFGNVVKVTDPKGNATFSYYDRLERIVATRDPQGYVTTTSYNRFGEVVETKRYTIAMADPGEVGIAVFNPDDLPQDPFVEATQLQQQADALDVQADAAEISAPQAQANANALADDADDADDLVANLEAQIAALGGAGISFSAERAAALANLNVWLNDRSDWLGDAKDIANIIGEINNNNFQQGEASSLESSFSDEGRAASAIRSLSNNSINNAAKSGYINYYYDTLTWRANNFGSDRSAAVASPLVWLNSRLEDLENQINGLRSLINSTASGWSQVNSRLQNASNNLEKLWVTAFQAAYDLNNNTYSGNWGSTTNLFENVALNAQYLPSGITHTTTQTSNYRANGVIKIYFDVRGATGGEPVGTSPAAALQAQLAQAIAAADTANTAADQAQVNANAASALAVQLRASATQAQAAATAALAAAQSGATSAILGNFVLIDVSELGSKASSYFSYDRLGRLAQMIDAGGYVETYVYSAFSDLVALNRYALSAYTASQTLPPAVQQAYNNASALQQTADTLNAQANLASVNASALQQEASSLASTAAGYLSSANSYTSQANGYTSQINSAFNSFWATLNNAQTSLSNQANNLLTELSYHNNYASSLPPEQQYSYYFNVVYPIQNQYNVVTTERANVMAVLNTQPNYSAGDTISVGSSTTAASAITNYNNLRQQKQTALNNAATATTQYNTANTAALQKQSQATAAINAASQAATAAATAQDNADDALAYAQQLESELPVGNGEDGPPSFEFSQLGAVSTTSFEYGNRGLLAKTTDAVGFSERLTYDAFGRLAAEVGKSSFAAPQSGAIPDGGTKTYQYDKRGLLLSETLPIQSYNSAGNALGAITHTYEYDARGNLIAKTEADGLPEERVTQYVYDNLGRLTQTIGESRNWASINASTKAVSSGSATPTETMSYDANGNVVRLQDPAGAVTVFYYDALNRKTLEINALGTYTSYEYDANGNIARIRVFENTVNVPALGAPAPTLPTGANRETTFTYNGLNQLIASHVHGVTTGSHTGTGWVVTNADGLADPDLLTTRYEYDYLGNAVKLIDPRGNSVWSYYDALGRKTTQVDGEGYRTDWSHNSDGNVLTERRYATKAAIAVSTTNPPSVATDGAKDRVTTYTYDKNGNRLTETRESVTYHNEAASQQGTNLTGSATVTYLYNGLGQVVLKTEATGEQFGYTYDAGGRLTQEVRPGFVGSSDTTVTPTINYSYDGLGNLVRSAQLGSGDAGARVTRYNYGAGGLLSNMIDADGKVRSYEYEVSGRLVLEHYTRTEYRANGTTASVVEGVGYRYDALGRTLGQALYTKPSTAWVFQSGNEYSTIAYNAFGDVTGIATNRSASDIASKGYQQQNKYDLAGRLWATNSGDGIWKYFGYDQNGNQTIAITSGGANMAGKTFAQALAMVSGADVNATYSKFDKRNMAFQTTEEGRQLSTTTTVDLVSSRTYNAFGEVASETDALGYTTTYVYNTMGRLARSESPAVSITLENGTSQWVKPSQDLYYDKSGRLVATRDANGDYAPGGTNSGNATSKLADKGNLNRLTLLAGTGYGGGNALVALETHADGGTVTNKYDIHGNLREISRATGIAATGDLVTQQTFDVMGRVTSVTQTARMSGNLLTGGLTQSYSYDELGNQVKNWNSVYGSGDANITTFDIQGRVASARTMGGDVTTTTYTWDDTSLTNAIGNYGGWVRAVSGEGYSATYETDLFGRDADVSKSYNYAGWMSLENGHTENPQDDYSYQYYNTGLLKSKIALEVNSVVIDRYHNTQTYYGKEFHFSYDHLGRLKTEISSDQYVSWSSQTYPDGEFPVATVYTGRHQDGAVEYDALGRITRYTDAGSNSTPDVDKNWKYDANGNVRSITTIRPNTSTLNYWYRYDSMNRVTISQGMLSGGSIGASTTGIAMSYDQADRRLTSQTGSAAQEAYTLNAQGLVTEVKIGGVSRIVSSYDLLGRMTGYLEKLSNGSTVYERHSLVYNSRNQILSEKGKQLQGSNWNYYHTTNYYNDAGSISVSNFPGALIAAGNVGESTGVQLYYTQTKNWKNGVVVSGTGTPAYNSGADGDADDTSLKNAMVFHETFGWRQGGQNFVNKHGTGSASWSYDLDGGILRVDRTVWNSQAPYEDVDFLTDINGLIVSRSEKLDLQIQDLPWTQTFRFGGKEMGVSTNNGNTNVDYATLINRRDDAPGTGYFLGGATSGTAYSNFDSNHITLAGGAQGDKPGSWTVRAGDTLQSIALAVWGDASMWYKIAQANGASVVGLAEGQVLMLPGAVGNVHHNANTIKPYDPAGALGDVAPPAAIPPRTRGGCGFLGSLIMSLVTVAVGLVLAPLIGPMGAGVASNLFGQGLNMATGNQQGFNWLGLATTALSAGVNIGIDKLAGAGGALGDIGQFLNNGSVGAGIVGGVATNAIGQGVSIALGAQDNFSWGSVAAAGVAGGLGSALGRNLQPLTGESGVLTGSNILSHLAVGGASHMAGAATRSAVEGSSFGTNLWSGLPDVIGQVLGRALGQALRNQPTAEQTSKAHQNGLNPRGAAKAAAQCIASVGKLASAAQQMAESPSERVEQATGNRIADTGIIAPSDQDTSSSMAADGMVYWRPAANAPEGEINIATGKMATERYYLSSEMQAEFDAYVFENINHINGLDIGAKAAEMLHLSYSEKQFQAVSWEDWRLAAIDGLGQLKPIIARSTVVGVEEYETRWDQRVRGSMLNSSAGAGAASYVSAMAFGIPQMTHGKPFEIMQREHGTAMKVGEGVAFAAGIISGASIGRSAVRSSVSAQRIHTLANIERSTAARSSSNFYGYVQRESLVRGSVLSARSITSNTRDALQVVTDRVVADLASNPGLARELMSPGSYLHLYERTNLAPASYGKAVERLTARYVDADPNLSKILQYQSRPFKSTPDFFGYEGKNLRLLDITTGASKANHLARPYGQYTDYVIHPGLPSNLVFPR